MDLILLAVLVGLLLTPFVLAIAGVAVVYRRRQREASRREVLAATRRLAFEDVTAFGEDLARLDSEVVGHALDEGARADYQRALDTYEAAKVASESLKDPDDMPRVAEVIADGRYAIECVHARVAHQPLPTRRPLCFFDPRHGMSVGDVPYVLPDGTERNVPACERDTHRIRSGLEPDARMVSAGGKQVPYWQGGQAYGPYTAGYLALDPLTWILISSLAFDGYGWGPYPPSQLPDPGGDSDDHQGDASDGPSAPVDHADDSSNRGYSGSDYQDHSGDSGSDGGWFDGLDF